MQQISDKHERQDLVVECKNLLETMPVADAMYAWNALGHLLMDWKHCDLWIERADGEMHLRYIIIVERNGLALHPFCFGCTEGERSVTCSGIRSLIKKYGISKAVLLHALSPSLVSSLRRSMNISWAHLCYVYAHDGNSQCHSSADTFPGKLRKLIVADAPTVDDSWPYRHDGSQEYIEHLIAEYPAVGVVIDDRLIGWGLTMPYGALGMVFVAETCRNHGVGAKIMQECTNAVLEYSKKKDFQHVMPPYAYIADGNESSAACLKKTGYKRMGPVYWVSIMPTNIAKPTENGS